MESASHLREILAADLALSLGLASAEQVADALQRRLEGGGGKLADDLRERGILDEEGAGRLEGAVADLLEEAQGDERLAVARRGGLDGSIHTSLPAGLSRTLAQEGATARPPLRAIATDRYRDFKLVGKGGMGLVYLAHDTELSRDVAFKMVLPTPQAPKDTPAPDTPLEATPPPETDEESARSFDEFRIRFLQEAWVTGAMEHPGVVPVYELGETTAGIPYYTMRYVTGELSLKDAIASAEDVDDRLALLEPFLKVCDTIRYAHARGIVHRDLKPENIAIGEFGEVIVLDWGLSKMKGRPDVSGGIWQQRIEEFRSAADLQTVAGALGTPGYMAPEAALGQSENVDERSDIYSLGVMLYQILTGELPHQFDTFVGYVQATIHGDPTAPIEKSPDLPRELSRVAMTALARERDDRYGTVDALASDVRRWLTEGSVDREVRFFLDDARAEIEAAKRLSGNAMLWHLDRATNLCSKSLHLRPDNADAIVLKSAIVTMRESGIEERVTGSRRQALQKVGVVVLALASIGALIVASELRDAKRAAEEQVAAARSREAISRQQAKRDRARTEEAMARLADGYAFASEQYLARDDVASARLAAAQGLRLSRTPRVHAALAAADGRWAPTLRRVHAIPDPTAVAFAPDGSEYYVAAKNGEVHAVATESGERRIAWRLPENLDFISRLAVSPDGTRVAFGTARAIGAFQQGVEEPEYVGRTVLTFDSTQPQAYVTSIAWHPAGGHVIAGYSHGDVLIWPLGQEPITREDLHAAAVTALVVTTDTVYTAGANGWFTRFFWNPFTPMSRVRICNRALRAMHVRDTEDGPELRFVDDEAFVRWHVIGDGQTGTVMKAAARSAVEVVMHSGGARFLSGRRDGSVEFWEIPAQRRACVLDGHGVPLKGIAMSESRNLLSLARADGRIELWDLRSGVDAPRMPSTLLGADLRRFLRVRGDRSIEVHALDSKRPPKVYVEHKSAVTAIATTVDGPLAASAGLNGELHLWNPLTSEKHAQLKDLSPPVTALAFMPGATHLVAGTLGGGLLIWRWTSPRPSKPEVERQEAVSCLAVSEDGLRIYAGYVGGAIDVWDVETLRRSEILPPRGASPAAIAVSKDRKLIAVATSDDRIQLRLLHDHGRIVAETSIPSGASVFDLGGVSDRDGVRWYALDGGRWHWSRDGGDPVRSARESLSIKGAGPTWLMRSPVRRLIDLENEFAARMEGMRAVPMSITEFRPDDPRSTPWSRLPGE